MKDDCLLAVLLMLILAASLALVVLFPTTDCRIASREDVVPQGGLVCGENVR